MPGTIHFSRIRRLSYFSSRSLNLYLLTFLHPILLETKGQSPTTTTVLLFYLPILPNISLPIDLFGYHLSHLEQCYIYIHIYKINRSRRLLANTVYDFLLGILMKDKTARVGQTLNIKYEIFFIMLTWLHVCYMMKAFVQTLFDVSPPAWK